MALLNYINNRSITILDSKYITPYFSDKISFKQNNEIKKKIKKEKPKEKFFNIGDEYTLSKEDCGDFAMPTKKYKLVGIVDKLNGVAINSVIMKQIEGEISTSFTLTKLDCSHIGVDFENGLQIFPINMGWVNLTQLMKKKEEKQLEVKVVEEKPKIEVFDPCNLSTYPLCITDNTIRHMMVKISNCIPNGDGVLLPNGKTIFKNGVRNLYVLAKEGVFGDNITTAYFRKSEPISYNIMTNKISDCCVSSQLVDSNGHLFIELNLFKERMYNKSNGDGYVGIEPSKFINVSLEDFIDIYTF